MSLTGGMCFSGAEAVHSMQLMGFFQYVPVGLTGCQPYVIARQSLRHAIRSIAGFGWRRERIAGHCRVHRSYYMHSSGTQQNQVLQADVILTLGLL